MSEITLQDALNDCIDRLATGQSIEDCLTNYPQYADQLRPLLVVGTAPSRLRADASELQAMRQRLDTEMESLIEQANFSQASRFFGWRGGLILLLSLAIATILIAILINNGNAGGEASATPTMTVTETATENLASATPTSTVTATLTATSTVTVTVTETAISTETVTQTETPTETPVTIATATEVIPSVTPSECVPRADWVEYRIRQGDSLSLIAVNSGTTVEALRAGNCLDDRSFIVAGTTLLVPRLWEQSQSDDNNSDDGSSSGGDTGGSSSGDDDSDDDDDDDDDDYDDDDYDDDDYDDDDD
ncbi:MAG: LysM peptidoglycan-binding domain-containing protein [Chloroflexota bacterium]